MAVIQIATLLIALATPPGTPCSPDYVGACVPMIAGKDVDCLGGEGDGPYYPDKMGPFQRIGKNRYDLDRDHDGLACEPPPDDNGA
jgi:hypothetical protein